ncbi:MAG: hypothetical protein QGI76_02805 [Dehalococcoidia bacterium]|jgi:hypothetical protein|nr:hypothetical protein [Dehalococcoidia bacterium]|tara:strand:- start:2062 stop:2265 length:204 start_codon:yes stop_codon:yes gene_type:complete
MAERKSLDPQFTNLRQAGVQDQFPETRTADVHPAAAIGQHSVEGPNQLGYSDQEISDVLAAGSIGIA